ncbi:hypothetical protein [Priestia megaterium]|uniref:hypothetical protein n=1 Tax=Priestia megaterium TaxID=1404 RepID=UPI0030001F4C
MLVRGMIEAISDKKLKVNDLAKKYEVSDRTIQTKIKKLGFEWDSVEGKYNFVGTDESIFDKDIDEVFKKNSKTTKQLTGTFPIQKRVKKNIRTANKEVASSIQKVNKNRPENDSDVDSESIIRKNMKKNNKKKIDNIDRLLAGRKAKREFRGFYLDNDVLKIIDNVDSGIKSELVNECLRKVFKEKGLI